MLKLPYLVLKFVLLSFCLNYMNVFHLVKLRHTIIILMCLFRFNMPQKETIRFSRITLNVVLKVPSHVLKFDQNCDAMRLIDNVHADVL